METLVSIVIPCYQGETYLRQAVDSCLAQTWHDLEIVLVDDASPDSCGAIAEEYAARDERVKVVHHDTNRGVAAAFNTGFDMARGAYLTRLAQDDVLYVDAIERLTTALGAAPTAAMIYADMDVIDDTGKLIDTFTTLPAAEALRDRSGIGLCWLFKREVWDEIGGLDPSYDQVEDFEYWIRASQRFAITRYECGPLLQFRRHGDMGTAKHGARMEALTGEILARYNKSWVQGRRAKGAGYFSASWVSRADANWSAARSYALMAILAWPFAFRHYKALFGSLLKRLAGD